MKHGRTRDVKACKCVYKRGVSGCRCVSTGAYEHARTNREAREDAAQREGKAHVDKGGERQEGRDAWGEQRDRAQRGRGNARTYARNERDSAFTRAPRIDIKEKARPKKGTTSFAGFKKPEREGSAKAGALGAATTGGSNKERRNMDIHASHRPTNNDAKATGHREKGGRENINIYRTTTGNHARRDGAATRMNEVYTVQNNTLRAERAPWPEVQRGAQPHPAK
jgi:hypothetical protein